MQIIVLIDSSGSMKEVLHDDNQGRRKVDIVRDHVISYLSSIRVNEPSNVQIYNFNNLPRLLASVDLTSAVEKLKSLKIDCGGGTKIWDSIHMVIEMEAKDANESIRIICLTDGGDQGSTYSFRDIQLEVQGYPHVKLLVIDIDGNLSEVSNEDEIIKRVTRKRSIKEVLSESDLFESFEHSLNRLDISVPIIPVIPCSDDDLSMISKAVQEVIPYLEELSGLRYYPVPTYLIDEYTFNLYLEKPLYDDMDKDKLRKTIDEFIRFYVAASLGLHVSRFNDDGIICAKENILWGQHYKWSEDSKELVRGLCEGFLGIPEYIRDGEFSKYFSRLFQLPELMNLNDNISKIEKTMRGLVDYYKELKEIYGQDSSIGADYFSIGSFLDKSITRDYPNLEIWKPYFSRGDYSKIRKCINKDGSWKKDLESISIVYEIALPVIIKLLKKWESMTSKWALIAENIRTYGVYLPRNHGNNQQLNKALQNQGYPAVFTQHETGKVLLCLERCKKRFEDYRKQNSEENEKIDFEALFSGLLKATLLHEHAHAITYEGVGKGEDQYYSSNKHDSAVSETLAEWAELNYFREHKIKDIYEIIYSHANSGAFPKWAYAGALILENSNIKVPRTIRFRSLMQYYRSDAEIAFSLLDSW